MKNSTHRLMLILFGFMLSTFAIGQESKRLFPGNKSKLEEAAAKADIIVVAKLIELGPTTPDALDFAGYHGAQIEVIKTLKGALTGKVTVSLRVYGRPGKDQETRPDEGKEHLFFIRTGDGKRLYVLKMLPATAANIAAASALISK